MPVHAHTCLYVQTQLLTPLSRLCRTKICHYTTTYVLSVKRTSPYACVCVNVCTCVLVVTGLLLSSVGAPASVHAEGPTTAVMTIDTFEARHLLLVHPGPD